MSVCHCKGNGKMILREPLVDVHQKPWPVDPLGQRCLMFGLGLEGSICLSFSSISKSPGLLFSFMYSSDRECCVLCLFLYFLCFFLVNIYIVDFFFSIYNITIGFTSYGVSSDFHFHKNEMICLLSFFLFCHFGLSLFHFYRPLNRHAHGRMKINRMLIHNFLSTAYGSDDTEQPTPILLIPSLCPFLPTSLPSSSARCCQRES